MSKRQVEELEHTIRNQTKLDVSFKDMYKQMPKTAKVLNQSDLGLHPLYVFKGKEISNLSAN